MIEGLLAEYLNNYLAKYIQNLDTENVTVGILSGNVELTDLQLKPEALFQLGLPIEVKAGYVGRISITWSWSGLFSGTTEPAVALVEDVYIVAAPLTDRKYDPQRERALRNAIKREKLAELEKSSFQDEDEKTEEKGGWFSFDFAHKFVATLVNNLEVCVERIHIRYEDRISNPEHPFACGLILEKLKASTTNSQWKATQVDAQATMIHKLVELKSLGAYWNWNIPDQGMLRNKLHTTAWRNLLKHSIDSHRIMEDNLDFIMRPVSANIKAVLNKKDNTTIPKVLADFVFQEIDILISRQQYLNMLSLADSFKMMTVNQRYRKYSPWVPLLGNAASWWKYAYNAVVHEFIRPYSWQRIKAHRQKYRRYKDLYKQRLHNPESTNLDQQLIDLEDDLDLPNILMAREQAKLEFSKEAPGHAERRRQGKSWWSWMWSSSESEDEEIVITKPKSQPGWLSQLTEEEREKIYQSIGYDENRNMEQSPQYVAHQLNIHLGSCSLTLVNYSNEILKVSVSKVELGFDNRPDSGGFRLWACVKSEPERGRARTEAFIVEGVSIEHELVPIITSEIGVYTPSQVSQVFICEFEINPVHVDADFALRLNVQPVEIVYDEHSMTEVIAFFQVPYVTQDDVYEVAQDGLNKLAKFSTAGLKYAIEQHKTVHLSVNMRSPYIVIPEYGTLHRGGNVLVVDFGKLKVESELRVKNISLENATLSEIEARLYDHYNITVSDVKALIADSGDDWHTAQTQPDTPYHILPSVGLELKFFNSVKPEYKLLPQQKVLAELPTLKLNISDEKLMMLMDFFKNVPFPHSNSMMGFDDSVDGPIVPVAPMLDEREVQHEPDWDELLHMKQAVLKNSTPRIKKHRDMVDASRLSTFSTGSEQYITASDHSDEDPEEWARGLDMPAVDDHTSPSNYIEVLLRFRLGEVVVHISKSADKIDTPYLMLRVDKMCSDVAKTKYGYTSQASLGGVQLVDKIHLGQSGEYLELLSSTAGSDLISMLYRQVSPDCPDFELVYSSVEQGIVIKLSRLDLVFDRAATLYLNSFVQSLMITSYLGPSRELAKSTSTILSAVTAPDPDSLSMAQKWFYDMAENAAKQTICPRHTKLHAFAKIKDIHVKFCNHEMDFADLAIKGLESSYKIKGLQTVIQAHLTDLSVQDLSGDAIYQQILSIEDNRLFDFKLVQYGKASHKHGISKLPSLDASLTLRIGQVQAVYLNKFNSQMMNFLDPFMNPETYQFYTVEAQRAVQTRLQDIQEQGTRISLNIDIKAPVVLLPQNSTSCELLFLKLGDMCFRNDFQDLELGGHRGTQQWDHIYMHLDSLQVHRAFLSDNGNLEQGRKLVEPISLKLDIKRALPPVHSDLNWEISGKLKHIQVEMIRSDYRVVIATLQQNFSEVSDKPDRIDATDLNNGMGDRMAVSTGSFVDDTMTPVVEVELPLLSAPDGMDILKQTKISFQLEGMTLTLLEQTSHLTELEPALFRHDNNGFAKMTMGQIDISGQLDNNGAQEYMIQLKSVAMDDIRKGSNLAVKRLIQCSLGKPEGQEKQAPMVEFKYKVSPEGNQHVDLVVETVRINVCVPYLLSVSHFFLDAMSSENEVIKENPVRDTTDFTPKLPHQEVGHADPILTVSGWVKQPELVLFAEPEKRNSRVLVLKTSAVFDYFSHQEKESTKAKISQLQIFSCVYGQRNRTAAMVLSPCDIEYTKSVESSEGGQEQTMQVSDLDLRLSATTVHIILDVVNLIRQDAQKPPDSADSCIEKKNRELWLTHNISSERWLAKSAEETKKLPHKPASALGKKQLENLKVKVGKVQVLFHMETRYGIAPMLCVKTGLEAALCNWSTQIQGHIALQLEVLYYHEHLAVWEPLLEPVQEGNAGYRPWEVMVKFIQAAGQPMNQACERDHHRLDELDGDMRHLMWKGRQKSDSSETDTESETEMTIIRSKSIIQRRVGRNSEHSYDSASRHSSSIQGESDSETEGVINTLSSNIDSLFTSDSSDADVSDLDEDAVNASDKPVFLTAKGPVQIDAVANDEVCGSSPDTAEHPCMYVLVDSRDQLLINVSPQAIDVLSDVSQKVLTSANLPLSAVSEQPTFEIFNKLEFGASVTLPEDTKIEKAHLHNVVVEGMTSEEVDEVDQALNDEDIDSTDGLSFVTQALVAAGAAFMNVAAFPYDQENMEILTPGNRHPPKENRLHLNLEGFNELRSLNHCKATSRLITLAPCKNDTNYSIIYEVAMSHGHKTVTIRSPLQIHNHLVMPVEVYCKAEELDRYGTWNKVPQDGDGFKSLAMLQPGEVYSVPLLVAYHCRVYIAPAIQGYNKSRSALWWPDLSVAKDRSKFYTCLPVKENNPFQNPFHFKVVCEPATPKLNIPLPKVVPYCTFHLHPPVVLHNLLPYDVQYSLEHCQTSSLMHGDNTPLHTADVSETPKLNLQIADYIGLDWTGFLEISNDLEEFKAITMETDVDNEGGTVNKQLSLSIHVSQTDTMDLYIYSPYWIINKTGLPIQLRGARTDAVYENDANPEPILFRYKKYKRKKAKLKVYNSRWTQSFSLDTVGSNGVIVCRDKERSRKYQFLMQIHMSKLSLTKIVTFLPYFLVVNTTGQRLRFMEENEEADLWHDITPGACIPFWPVTDSLKMYLKYEDSNVSSQHFSINKPMSTVLRMDRGSALVVEVCGGIDTSMTITFQEYDPGDAPVRIDNLCEDVHIKLHQKNQSQASLLAPNQSMLYTWDDPTAERTLYWNVYCSKKPSHPAFITEIGKGLESQQFHIHDGDKYGEVLVNIQSVQRSSRVRPNDSSPDDDSEVEETMTILSSAKYKHTKTAKVTVYWVSFLDGPQRVLLFTQDERIAKRAKKMHEGEPADLALFTSLAGINLSVINGLSMEVALVSLASAPAMWEVEVKHKWKVLDNEFSMWLEEKWRSEQTKAYLDERIEADLLKMEMKKPFIGRLRRNYEPAVWLQFQQSQHQRYIYAKLHRLQIDNQLPDAYFPTALYPVPVPPHMARKGSPKPCIEFAMMRRQVPENDVNTVKFCKLLVQEFNLKVDKGFMLSVMDVLTFNMVTDPESQQLQKDLSVVHRSLRSLAAVQAELRPQRVLFEYLHLSPLKLHLSFSLDGKVHTASLHKNTSLKLDAVDFFLNSVGATLTEIKDVEVRMAYFEKQGVLMTWGQLQSEVQSHYVSQAIKQGYVLLLGLDVLGNPYGLIKDFTQGLGDFFYEPVMGSIGDPDRFSESLVRGVRSLFGHSVGGVASSVSLITGSLGKALAALSFDQDYKRRRRRKIMQHKRNLPHSLLLAGRGFVMGVALGLSGVIVQPVRGAQEEGIEGFFKGMGKGMLGLLTKPVGGAVDMVSMAADGIRRAAELGEDIIFRQRLPRYIHPVQGLTPYDENAARGQRILNCLAKGRFIDTDIYLGHAPLKKEEKPNIMLITNRHLFHIEKCRMWGEWDILWEVSLSDIVGPPAVKDNSLIFKVNKDDTGFSLFTSNETSVACEDPEVLNWLQKKIEQALKSAHNQ